jgi:hypothetical protein
MAQSLPFHSFFFTTDDLTKVSTLPSEHCFKSIADNISTHSSLVCAETVNKKRNFENLFPALPLSLKNEGRRNNDEKSVWKETEHKERRWMQREVKPLPLPAKELKETNKVGSSKVTVPVITSARGRGRRGFGRGRRGRTSEAPVLFHLYFSD